MDVWTVAKARAASILIGAAGALLVGSGCQRSPDAEGEGRAVVLATDPMQFESVNDWRVTQGHAPERAITSVRTQGAGALALTAPSAHTRLESKPIASTNPRLGAIDVGAKLLLDFLLPVEQHDPFWFGSVEVSLTVPSRRVLDASLGRVELTGIRTGIFTTLRFGVPDAVALALEGASYGDLTFAITVHAPKLPSGAYVLDNLRFKAGHLPPRPTSGADIAAGASILLEASKAYSPPADSPASHAFSTGIIQVPQAFHVVQGKAGSGSATFEYRIGSAATVVCTYPAAGGDGSTYAFGSCSGEARAGDLVPADFVRLAIVNGDPAAGKTKVKAQIALNPVGDEMVAGLPPIPTFFGSTAAEVRDALDAFVQQQRSWQISEVELVTLPTPAIPATPLVIRNGTVISPPPPGDPQFPLSGRLTNSDLADAGWHVTGGLAGPIDASTRDTDFHVDMGVDVWLLGFNITDVLGISGSVTTHTEPFDGEHPPTTTELATFCHQYFGFGGSCVGPFDRTDGLDQLIVSTEPNITLFDIDYWLFNVTGTARLTLEARATGNFAGAGFNVGIEPQIGAVMRVRGELGAGPFAGAGLFADFTLIDFSPAISASVTTTLNADPRVCSVHVKETFSGTVTVHTGGGAIGYFVEGGACCGCFVEICWRDEGNLYTWPSDTTTYDLIPETPLADQDLALDPALCAPKGDAEGGVTYPRVGQSFRPGDFSFLDAAFARDILDESQGIVIPTPLDCRTFSWFSNGPDDVISLTVSTDTTNGPACYTKIRYGSPGTRTLTVIANDPDLGTGSATREVEVVAGDRDVAPIVAITRPAALTRSTSVCAIPVAATGTATDPGGLDVTLAWSLGTFPDDTSVPTFTAAGTGVMVDLKREADIIRLVGTDTAGNEAGMEIPVSLECVQ